MEDLQISTWVNDIETEMLPEPYRKLSSILGVENVLKLAVEFQGTNIYFPKLDGTLKLIRDKKICDDYRGQNIKELARKYGLTETWVRQILQENAIDSNQMCLFETDL